MPAVNVSMLDGQLAWRQHDGGHTDGPELEVLHSVGQHTTRALASIVAIAAVTSLSAAQAPADQPAARTDENSRIAHTQLLEKARGGPHRRLLCGRLNHAALGRHRSARVPGQLDVELLRLERRQLRMGRGHDAEHPVAAAQRRTRPRPPARHRPSGRDQQHREHDIARRRGGGCGRRYTRYQGDRGHDAVEGPDGHDRPDGNLPSQRRHQVDASYREQPIAISRRSPMDRRFASWTSTTSSRIAMGNSTKA